MTSLIEKIVAIIAPHRCIVCGSEDNILCIGCQNSELLPMPSVCCLCGEPSRDWVLCLPCQSRSGMACVWAAGKYAGIRQAIIRDFKFQRLRAAYEPLSADMLRVLPYNDWLVVPVPTAFTRARQRGYDQAELLARHIAKTRQLPLEPLLRREKAVRQVGTTRVQRQAQSIKMFSIVNNPQLRGTQILLVDDVCTTGATLSAAAQLLRQAGAARIDAVVAAWQPPTHQQTKSSR